MGDRIEVVVNRRRQAMVSDFSPLCCDECGVEINWTPVVIDGRPYCCHDCAVGLECSCASNDQDWEEDAEPSWMGGFEGRVEPTFGIDYGFE
jgi:hypothetical protein